MLNESELQGNYQLVLESKNKMTVRETQSARTNLKKKGPLSIVETNLNIQPVIRPRLNLVPDQSDA